VSGFKLAEKLFGIAKATVCCVFKTLANTFFG